MIRFGGYLQHPVRCTFRSLIYLCKFCITFLSNLASSNSLFSRTFREVFLLGSIFGILGHSSSGHNTYLKPRVWPNVLWGGQDGGEFCNKKTEISERSMLYQFACLVLKQKAFV